MSSPINLYSDSALFCSFPGCMALLHTPYSLAEDLKAQAEAAGWEVDTALNRCLCPDHRGGAPVGAFVRSDPPEDNPGIEMECPESDHRVLVGV